METSFFSGVDEKPQNVEEKKDKKKNSTTSESLAVPTLSLVSAL